MSDRARPAASRLAGARRIRRSLAAVAGLSLVAALAACSSSGGARTSGSPSTAATGSASSGSAAPTGKPLTVFFFNEQGASAAASSPESYQAAQAAVAYVNGKLGGIKGRPLKLIHCATIGTPDSVTNCANKAIDAHPDVVVKGVETASATAVPILAAAGIPYVTLNAGTPSELDNPDSFVLSSGFTAQLIPPIPYAKDKGFKHIGVVYADLASLSGALSASGAAAKLAARDGIKYTTIPVAITTGDLTPAYSSVRAKKVDAIYVVGSAAQCVSALKARASLSDATPLFLASACDVSSVLNTVPSSVTAGALIPVVDTSEIESDKDTSTYRAAMHEYEPSADVGGWAPTSFAAIMDLYNVISKAPDANALDAAKIKQMLDAARDVPMFMGGGKTFSCDHTAFAGQSSVCSRWSFLVSYDNGKYKLVGAYDAADLLHGV